MCVHVLLLFLQLAENLPSMYQCHELQQEREHKKLYVCNSYALIYTSTVTADIDKALLCIQTML